MQAPLVIACYSNFDLLTIFHCSHNYLRAFWASASTVECLNNDGIVTKGFQLFDGPIQTSLQRRISHEPHKTIFTSFVYSCITLAKTEIMYQNVRAKVAVNFT